ncbi:MAG TPA: NAD(P)-dependent oxidoreductase, partial [Terriglobales bacterium]|nr:NAD(P)-dependent oxidoreductase [Terriglobales bacterium]
MRIAFIGLGHMGLPMAANLVKAGHQVQGYDAIPEALAAATAQGVTAHKSLAAAAAGVDAAITMLPNGEIARAVWRELAPALTAGIAAIDCSTIDILAAKDIHTLAASHGLLSVDAPVSGGVTGAQAATLTFMCGGQPAALDAAEPILGLMGKKVVRCGSAGSGQAAKICN